MPTYVIVYLYRAYYIFLLKSLHVNKINKSIIISITTLLKQGRRKQHKEGCKQQPLLGSKSGTGVK